MRKLVKVIVNLNLTVSITVKQQQASNNQDKSILICILIQFPKVRLH